jgi:CBS domain-containing protein
MAVAKVGRKLVLAPCSVSELMTDNPLSIPSDATALEAVQLLTARRFSAAPVINEAGHPVGVVSRSDLLKGLLVLKDIDRSLEDDWFQCGNMISDDTSVSVKNWNPQLDVVTVSEIMTPLVIGLAPDDSIERAVELMLTEQVHRLFVMDDDGVLIGVISTFDILRNLKAQAS